MQGIYQPILFGAFLALLLASVPAAHADEAEDVAKKHFKAGETHYKLGRFKEALAEFSAAYEAKALPEFLFNIGQCQKETGNHERAVFFFEQYIHAKPASKNRTLVETLIGESKRELEKEAAERKRLEDEKKQREVEEQKRQDEEAARRAEALKPPPFEARKGTLQWPFALRKEPDPKGEEVASLPKDTPITVFGLKGSWSQVEDAGGTRGWVPSEYVAYVTSDEAQAVPIYKKWWFWTIVGGAAAAATGGTVWAVSAGGGSSTGSEKLPAGSLGTLDRR